MRRDRTLEYDILREMSPRRKLDVMSAVIRQAYELQSAAIRASEPDVTSEGVLARIRGSGRVTDPDLIDLFIRPPEASGA